MSPLLVQDRLKELLSEPVPSVQERERTTLRDLLAANQNKVVLFGAGNLGRRALRCLRSIGIEPLALSDNNPTLWGNCVEGAPVLQPAMAAQRFGTQALFLVTIWNTQHRFVETRRQLEQLGCNAVSAGAPLYWYFATEFLPSFCQDLPHKVYEDADNVERATQIWADQESKSQYLNQILWRTWGNYDCLSAPEVPETYFPAIIKRTCDEVLIDCGAYDGDTIREFMAHAGTSFKAITAIEADANNFARLQAYLNDLPSEVSSKITPLHCAVSSAPGVIRFDDTGGVNSRISGDGAAVVNCIRLDDLLARRGVTYIKMDIEGAECDALQGAARSITRERPVLAICVYHRQNDLWRLPLLMKDLVPDYKMYLRMYETEGSQTVAYAVPPDRVLDARASS